MEMKTNSQVLLNDDGWCLAGINGGPGDDFPVEELLNLDFQPEEPFFQEEEVSVSKLSSQHSHSNSLSHFSGAAEFDNLLAGELSVPVTFEINLWWLCFFFSLK